MLDPDSLAFFAARLVEFVNEPPQDSWIPVEKAWGVGGARFVQDGNVRRAWPTDKDLAGSPPSFAAERDLSVQARQFLIALTRDRWRRRRKDHNKTMSWEPLPRKRLAELRALVARDWARPRRMKDVELVSVASRIEFDEDGHARLGRPQFDSIHSAIAVTFAALLDPSATVEIKVCPLCWRFYTREIGPGQPRIGCGNACTVAIRKNRMRKKS
jgi:hypothetical protein